MNKMKGLLMLLTFFLQFIVVSAQDKTNDQITSPTNDLSTNRGVILALKKDYSDIKAKGSPYFEEDFKEVDIYIDNKFYKKSMAKFNSLKDNIEIYAGNQSFSLSKRENIEVIFPDYRYKVIDHNGKKEYYLVFNEFEKTSLLLKPKKNFREGKEPTSSYEKYIPAQYLEDYKYYLKHKNGQLEQIKLKKKEILAVLKDHKTEIEKYASINKLSFKKEADLVKIINYYNTL